MIAGQQLTATLRLVRPLGQGAMGSVWVADHLTLGTRVAVKFMAPVYVQHSGFAERFRREAMAAAQIKHPHVAHVIDHGVTSDGALYIAMELLDGETLRARIDRLGALHLAEVVRIVGQTAKALGRAHHLGIVHRDVKPDNLFVMDLDGEPFVKILDFGVAKLDQSGTMNATSTGSLLGTPLYMSPEQLLSAKHVDYQADLWALAVVTYQALTGGLPFVGDTVGALSVAVHAGTFAPPSARRPGLPPAVDAWMARALQRDPNARFRSAKEMAEALEHAAGMPRVPSVYGPASTAPATPPAPPHAGLQSGLGSSEGQSSAPPVLGGSGASASTLHGLAATKARRRQWQAPVAIGAVLVGGLLATVGGVFVVHRTGAGRQDEAAAAGSASAAGAPAPLDAPAGTHAAASAASAPAAGPPGSASAPAGAASHLQQQSAGVAATGSSEAKPQPTAVPGRPPPKPKSNKVNDDIGF
jgi:eukaryotic-like serine/threonine-protein kinase